MSTDPLDRLQKVLDEAVQERDTLRQRVSRAESDAAQARRNEQTQQDRNRRLQTTIQQLEQRVLSAEQVADSSRQAMLDHAART